MTRECFEDIQWLIFGIVGRAKCFLKKDKSRDADGYSNELFMLTVAGEDLQLVVLKLLNKIFSLENFVF